MLRRLLLGLLAGAVVLTAGALATAPADLVHQPRPPVLNGALEDWLASRERAIGAPAALIPGTEKRIRWFAGQRDTRTRFAIVYLHGFSATRQEIAPVAERVADALGAHLFETRLTGHGLLQAPLTGVRAEQWLDDAAEALAIGTALGDEVIVMGTSTGATLALAMAGHPSFARVSSLVLLSPNFAPSDAGAEVLTWPGGPQLAWLIAGDTRSWTSANAQQARYWTTTYPMAAVVEVMRLVKHVRMRLPLSLEQSLLVLYSPADTVVDPARIEAAFLQISSPRSELVAIERSGDPSNHVLAGNILSPATNDHVAATIIRFLIGPRS